ncbi:Uncharacterised protein [Mycobacteroides abscessus subsp. abscessus]|uniref:hypothetical protein n=1 Tax=Mycobacteroides abscessus TaxID=36809 RepID=UPI00092BE256|nr:hypothetical protein [Mycobacteroides abscessus]SHS99675.1 Uncharacterised protein [Mycobacteroides abscessus subsp. abscessus]
MGTRGVNFYYPTSETFNVEYDESGRAYLTLNGIRYGVRNSSIDYDWMNLEGYEYPSRNPKVQLTFDLVELYEPPKPAPKPKRTYANSMGLRKPTRPEGYVSEPYGRGDDELDSDKYDNYYLYH